MKNLRSWATPLTIASALLMSVTGILMFFHLETTLGKVVHEWAGWAMVAGVGAHLALNWRPFTLYFKRRAAVAIMAVGMALLGLTMLPIAGGGGNPMMVLADAALTADAEVVMQLVGHDWAEGQAILAAQGVDIAPGQSLAEVLGEDRGARFGALEALLAK